MTGIHEHPSRIKTEPSILKPLPKLSTWRDDRFHSAGWNMALDQAIFDHTSRSGEAVIRFYHWDHPAITVGYFRRPSAEKSIPGGVVRRFTGGGQVEHGEDLTFVLTLPPGSEHAMATSEKRYRWIHTALQEALDEAGHRVRLERTPTPSGTGPCFETPVTWDLLDPSSGEKIGGGAQRRSRGGVIHQGSLRLPNSLRNPRAEWIRDLVSSLSEEWHGLEKSTRDQLDSEASPLFHRQFGHPSWNEAAG
ncbi:MAG: hypothetical protein AAGA96_12815 [Verrucomicrobiota bacterium]